MIDDKFTLFPDDPDLAAFVGSNEEHCEEEGHHIEPRILFEAANGVSFVRCNYCTNFYFRLWKEQKPDLNYPREPIGEDPHCDG